ncbi:hypothetical protein ACFC0P_38045 [Streptomyces broussonetiae]|uniref:hypothetical protein n=1 Tax=Streptomyces broussonetiae TaxID=2686304 RepID=UPI0035D7161B
MVVTGYPRLVTDPGELDRIRTLWEPRAPEPGMDQAVRIRPELVTGVLLTGTDEPRRHQRGPARDTAEAVHVSRVA